MKLGHRPGYRLRRIRGLLDLVAHGDEVRALSAVRGSIYLAVRDAQEEWSLRRRIEAEAREEWALLDGEVAETVAQMRADDERAA